MAQNFRFDDVLFAFDMKAPALRRWLQFGLVGDTAKGKAREGWTLEFNYHDIAVLALVKAMVDFGMPVAIAYKFAVRMMRQQGPWSGDEPAEAHWIVWAPDSQILISRVLGKNGKAGWGVATFEHAEEAFTCGAHLTLYPHALIRAAIERAAEAVEFREAKRRA